MTPQNAQEVLESIFWTCVVEDGFYAACSRDGFLDSSKWPNTPVLQNLREFESLVKTKNISFAQMHFAALYPDTHSPKFRPTDLATVRLLHEQAREVLLSQDLIRLLSIGESPFKVAEEFLRQKGSSIGVGSKSLGELTSDFIKENERLLASGKALVKIHGWPLLSEMIGGFNPGRITIITAGTGVGKTNLSINLSRSACVDGDLRAAFVNMEMNEFDIAARYASAIAGLPRSAFNDQSYMQKLSEKDALTKIIQKSDAIHITLGKGLSLREIESWVAMKNRSSKLDLAFLDYDQKIRTDGKEDEWKMLQRACESLEEMAKREDLHVVLLSQADTEKDGIPRASRRMMQSASTVLFFDEAEIGLFTIKAIKNRYGATGAELVVNYQPEKSLVTEQGRRSAPLFPGGRL